MKKVLFAGIALVSLIASANAADLPPKPFYKAPAYATAYNWSGFYVGVVGGGGWAESSHTDNTGITTGHFNQSGGTVGGTLGYNWQAGNIVFGLEGDVSWANINGSSSPVCLTPCFTKIRSIDTARGRIGMAFDNWLPYITGGAAVANIDAGQSGAISGSNTRLGATAGAGVEWMFAQNWSAKAEYLYTTFDTQSTYGTPSVSVSERNVNLFRLGVDYHF